MSLLSCESWMFVKENPDKKEKNNFRLNKFQIVFWNCILVWYVDQSAIFSITFKLRKESYFSMRTRTRCSGHLIGQFLHKPIYATNGTPKNHIMYRLLDIMKIVRYRYHTWHSDTLYNDMKSFARWGVH